MTFTRELDLDNVKKIQLAKYDLGERSQSYTHFNSYCSDTQTNTHTEPTALPGTLKWSVKVLAHLGLARLRHNVC